VSIDFTPLAKRIVTTLTSRKIISAGTIFDGIVSRVSKIGQLQTITLLNQNILFFVANG
jgi:hypothetical protein